MPTTEPIKVPVELGLDAQRAYDMARGLAVAWLAFADRLAHEMGDEVCTHPKGQMIPMNEERSVCGLCGRHFLN